MPRRRQLKQFTYPVERVPEIVEPARAQHRGILNRVVHGLCGLVGVGAREECCIRRLVGKVDRRRCGVTRSDREECVRKVDPAIADRCGRPVDQDRAAFRVADVRGPDVVVEEVVARELRRRLGCFEDRLRLLEPFGREESVGEDRFWIGCDSFQYVPSGRPSGLRWSPCGGTVAPTCVTVSSKAAPRSRYGGGHWARLRSSRTSTDHSSALVAPYRRGMYGAATDSRIDASRSICRRALVCVAALTNALRPSASSTSHFSACVCPATTWSHDVGRSLVAVVTAAMTAAGGFTERSLRPALELEQAPLLGARSRAHLEALPLGDQDVVAVVEAEAVLDVVQPGLVREVHSGP